MSAYDKEFNVAKLKLISASVNSLNLKANQPAPQLNYLIQTHNSAPQTTLKNESTSKTINSISSHATRVHKHIYYLSPAPRIPAAITNCNLNNSKSE